jgi:hypothetical protein
MYIRSIEFNTPSHRWEDGTETFAVTARITNLHDPCNLLVRASATKMRRLFN